MKFGRNFLAFKAISLVFRAVVFLIVLTFSNNLFGANHLMEFISVVTISGIILGFGASDSVAICSESQAKFVSQRVLLTSLIAFVISLLVLMGSNWMNLIIACLNYGLSHWNLGLIRRRNPILYEKLSNFQMLIFWSIYLAIMPLETSEFMILSILYGILNIALVCINISTREKKLHFTLTLKELSLVKVSSVKVFWQFSYSSLTRMIFILPGFATLLHPAFSYAYLLFELTSAMCSHYQTVFLRSDKLNTNTWIRLSLLIFAANTAMLLALIISIHFSSFFIDYWDGFLAERLNWMKYTLGLNDVIGLAGFMLAMSLLQSVDYGRYSFNFEANLNFAFVASILSVTSYFTLLILQIINQLNLIIVFAIIFFNGLLLMTLIHYRRFN